MERTLKTKEKSAKYNFSDEELDVIAEFVKVLVGIDLNQKENSDDSN